MFFLSDCLILNLPVRIRPFYTLGCSLGSGLTGLIIILALRLHLKLSAENEKRDERFGFVDPEEHLDVSVLGDQHPKFRYLT